MVDFKNRGSGEEIMDDFDLKGEELEKTLSFLENINKWLGGYAVLLSGMKKILAKIHQLPAENSGQTTPITIFDAGCGSGDSLRAIADWNKNKNYPLRYIGVDANEFTIEDARKKSVDYPHMVYRTQDIFSKECSFDGVDIVVCGLFMHHLSEADQIKFIDKCFAAGVQAILVNDLHRHWMGYYLFHIICAVFKVPYMVKHDGLLSILKAFKRPELEQLMQKTGVKCYDLHWKWAFRYQLIAYKKC